jgi:hypothetical protein
LSPERPENGALVEAGSPVLAAGHSYASVTDKISSIVLVQGTKRGWWLGFALAFALFMVFNMAVAYLLYRGVGIWGINIPVAWGFAIVNFVWWIGIGHAGTLISAFLLLMRQTWRQSINRFAEAMTLFAVASCTWAARGWLTGYCLTRTRWGLGRNSAARWSGTFLQFPRTQRFRSFSGLWD